MFIILFFRPSSSKCCCQGLTPGGEVIDSAFSTGRGFIMIIMLIMVSVVNNYYHDVLL